MGWDAFSTAYVARCEAGESLVVGFLPEFEVVSDQVLAQCGTVDWMLKFGALDCSACADAIEVATGQSAWDTEGWSPERVRALVVEAKWDKCEQEQWAVLSAKAFVETCATMNLGVSFSW